MRRNPFFLALLLTLGGACGDPINNVTGGDTDAASDSGSDGPDFGPDVNLDVTDDDRDGDGLPNALEDLNLNGRYDPGTLETDADDPDTDGDGLIDGTEDANRNGQVDPGETDPRLADTDGDGLDDGEERRNTETDPTLADSDGDGLDDGVELRTAGTDPNNPDSDNDGLRDGEEDRDGDGVVDPTETDPNLQDTDDDGILDANEAVQVACAASRQPEVTWLEDSGGDFALALPEEIDESGLYALRDLGSRTLRGAYFQESAGPVFGFVVAKVPDQPLVDGAAQAAEELGFIADLGAVRNRSVTAGVTWDGHSAGMARFDLVYDAAVPASRVRDELTAAVARQPTSQLGPQVDAGPSATDWVVRLVATARSGSELVVVAAMVPANALVDDADAPRLLEQMADATALGRFGERPGRRCVSVDPPAADFPVDILWLVDASVAMDAQRERVAEAAGAFFAAMDGTTLDYRVGVASTGMHTDSSWLLVSPGFSASPGDFSAQIADPPGGTTENGLETGLNIIELARGSGAAGGTRLRPEAKTIVVFFTDEQDQGIDFQIRQGVPGCAPELDVTLAECPLLQDRIEDYRGAGVTAFALVGDVPGGCDAEVGGGGVAGEAGHGYIQVAYATGGGFGSLCAANVSRLAEQIVRMSVGSASTLVLDPPPVAHTLRVVADGDLLAADPVNGWEYVAEHGTLVFHGTAVPTAETELYLSYQALGAVE